MIREVKLEKIQPNPWQPNRPEDPEGIRELADSIRTHGLIEVPVGRPGPNDTVELASGHRRLAAFKLLAQEDEKFRRLPVRVKDLTDRQMADIAVQENIKRKDLDPISLASFYKKYMHDFKVSQTQLAEIMGVSQGEISNTIRLLKLPDFVKEKVISREIPERHAREMLILADHPDLLKDTVNEFLTRPCSASDLARRIHSRIIFNSQPLFGEGYGAPLFDTRECQKCKYNVIVRHFDESRHPRCLNRDCWNKKQEKAQKEKIAQLLESTEEGTKEAVIPQGELRYGEYQFLDTFNISRLDNPAECENCPHHRRAQWFDEVKDVCLNPKCFSKKVRIKSRQEGIERRRLYQDQGQRFEDALSKAGVQSRRCYEVMIQLALQVAWSATMTWFQKTYGEKDEPVKRILQRKSDEELQRILPRVLFEAYRIMRGELAITEAEAYVKQLEGLD